MPEGSTEVTQLLNEMAHGDRAAALDKLFPIVYSELRILAGSIFRNERADQTLQPTALLHEAYLRLVDARVSAFEGRRQFFGLAAMVMRRILVDHARERRANKRGGGHHITLTDDIAVSPGNAIDAVDLGQALDRLESLDPELCRVFEIRFFAGCSVEETAELLAVSTPTVKRRWSAARAWLARELRGNSAAAEA